MERLQIQRRRVRHAEEQIDELPPPVDESELDQEVTELLGKIAVVVE